MFISLRSKVISRIAEANKAEQLKTLEEIRLEREKHEELMNKFDKEKSFLLGRLDRYFNNLLNGCKSFKALIIHKTEETDAAFDYNYFKFHELSAYLGFETKQHSNSTTDYFEMTIPEFDHVYGKEMTIAQKRLSEFNSKLEAKKAKLYRMTLADCKKIKKMIKNEDYTITSILNKAITLDYNFDRSLTDYELNIIADFFEKKGLYFDIEKYRRGPYYLKCTFSLIKAS